MHTCILSLTYSNLLILLLSLIYSPHSLFCRAFSRFYYEIFYTYLKCALRIFNPLITPSFPPLLSHGPPTPTVSFLHSCHIIIIFRSIVHIGEKTRNIYLSELGFRNQA
jgi:hypothetical protein